MGLCFSVRVQVGVRLLLQQELLHALPSRILPSPGQVPGELPRGHGPQRRTEGVYSQWVLRVYINQTWGFFFKFAFYFIYLGCRTSLYRTTLNILHARLHFVCAECPADCESCVSSDMCKQCRPGLYQLSGMCHHVCPEDYEPNDKLMECIPQGQSSVSVDMLKKNVW